MDTKLNDETSVTQPYSPNRCWFEIHKRDVPRNVHIFCSRPALLYRIQRAQGLHYATSNPLTVQMWLCDEHKQRTENRGYTCTKIPHSIAEMFSATQCK